MQCEDYELEISGMVDGVPQMPGAYDLFGHIATCAGCQDFLRSLLRIRNAEAELLSESLVPESSHRPARPVSSPRTADRGRSRHGILRQRITVSVSSAAIALVMLVLWSVVLALTVVQGEGSATRDARGLFSQPPLLSPVAGPGTERPPFTPR
jgi:hypothetical protein